MNTIKVEKDEVSGDETFCLPMKAPGESLWVSLDVESGMAHIFVGEPGSEVGSNFAGPVDRDDAIGLINILRKAFDIPSREEELEQLLEQTQEKHLAAMEHAVTAGIANIMYENGLRKATITPQNVMSGFVPSLSIDVSRPGVLTYILNGDPLNAKDNAE